jgi:hypothetical protein
MKRLTWTIVIIIIAQQISGQNYRFSINAGYGFYHLYDLKDLQTDLVKYKDPLPVKAVEKFPDYLNFATSFEFQINKKNLIGVAVAYYSTGGRNHLKDYSGEYKLDMLVSGYRFGLQYSNVLSSQNKFNLYAQLKAGIMLTSLDIDEYFNLYQIDTISSKHSFQSEALFCEPALGIWYSLGKHFSIDFNVGYEIDSDGKFYEKDNEKIELHRATGDNVHGNWSGLRISLGIAYDIF